MSSFLGNIKRSSTLLILGKHVAACVNQLSEDFVSSEFGEAMQWGFFIVVLSTWVGTSSDQGTSHVDVLRVFFGLADVK